MDIILRRVNSRKEDFMMKSGRYYSIQLDLLHCQSRCSMHAVLFPEKSSYFVDCFTSGQINYWHWQCIVPAC